MRIVTILIITLLGIQTLIAEEPTVERLALKIKILEQKVEALSAQVEASSRIEQLAPDGAIVIHVLVDGSIEVEGEIVSDVEVAKKLQAISVRLSDQPLQIRASKETKYKDILRVIELCQKSGISNVSFTTAKIPDEPLPELPKTEFELAVHSFAQSICIPLNTNQLNKPWVKARELYINDGLGGATVVVFGKSIREDNAWIGFVARIRPDVVGRAMTVRFDPVDEPSAEAIKKINNAWDGLLDKALPRGRFTGPDASWRLYSRQGDRADLEAEFGFGPGADTTLQRARLDALLEALGVAKSAR